MLTLLRCTVCDEIFRSRSGLNNHVRRTHQLSVKVQFNNGEVRNIQKGYGDVFTCVCGKEFKHPISLRRHSKICIGFPEPNDGAEPAGNTLPAESINNDGVTAEEDLSDCIGLYFGRTC